jgi:peroxiredoxin
VFGLVGLLRADDPKPKKPAVEASAGEKAFADSVRAAQKVLRQAKAYTVVAEGKWRLTGGKKELSGANTVRVVAENPGKLRIDVGAAGDRGPHLVVACDGKAITRHFAAAKLYSVTPCDGNPRDDLQADGVTTPALREVGVDFLVRPDMLAVLTAQTLSVTDLGVSEEKGAKAHGYRLKLADGHAVTVRFADGDTPLPVEVASAFDVPAGEKKTYIRTLTTKLTWDLAAKPAADAFAVIIPADARKVDDLMDAVLAPDVTELLGRPAPDVAFTGLDGKPVRLADYMGKSPVVLYAWATWAAPSTADLPALAEFVAAYTAKGVTFVAVNVGDSPRAVRRFAEAAKYPGVIALDPKGAGLAEVRAAAVPAVVVVGKDGTVQAYHRGKPDTAGKVKADLDTLLAGGSLVPKK